MAKRRKIWVVESCCHDEDQKFADVIAAGSSEEAVREAKLLRERYAEGFEACTLAEHIKWLKRGLKVYEKYVGKPEKAQKEWDEFLKQEDPELVRDENGRLTHKEDLEDEDE